MEAEGERRDQIDDLFSPNTTKRERVVKRGKDSGEGRDLGRDADAQTHQRQGQTLSPL